MIVGIDLGTTNSLCAIFENGEPKLIKNAHGSLLTPSVVGVLENGQVLVGQSAREYRVTHPERCASRFKQLMGTTKSIKLADQSFTAPQLSSLVLKSLKQDAETELGIAITDAVITVPAYFNDLQRRATHLAGELAGLRVRRIINEPTAAALTYGFHDRHAEKHLLVFDLGGGTFDVTLMEIFEGTLEIVATAGESMLGGEDFTDRIVAVMLQAQGASLETLELKQPLRVARLRQLCENAKIHLVGNSEVEIPFPDEQGTLQEGSAKFKITLDSFREHSSPLLNRLLPPIHRVLRDSGRSANDIDEAIFVGGATRMRCIQDFLRERLHISPQSRFNPDEVVALGAAVQAALISEESAVEEMILTDVCPHTLGVEVVKHFGSQMDTGYFNPIIHRNTTLPVSREELLATVYPNQPSMTLNVYQGEGRKVKDNLLLGSLNIDGVPPGPAGTPICVRFTYDLNGILEVEAFVPSSNKKFHTVLTQPGNYLTKAEVAAAVKKMQAIKFYPRDDIENQRLLRYCERIIGEVSPVEREQLEIALDRWESALNSGNRDEYQEALQLLKITLLQFGFDTDELDS